MSTNYKFNIPCPGHPPDSNNGFDVAGFQPGTPGARMIILLHELAHKVLPPGSIGIDDPIFGGAKPGTSEKNTATVADHCLEAINAVAKMM